MASPARSPSKKKARRGNALGVSGDRHWWRASISVNGRQVKLGSFPRTDMGEDEAAWVYDCAVVRLHGRKTSKEELNFPEFLEKYLRDPAAGTGLLDEAEDDSEVEVAGEAPEEDEDDPEEEDSEWEQGWEDPETEEDQAAISKRVHAMLRRVVAGST